MGGYLMDKFVDRERLAALVVMCKSYKTHIDIKFLARELAFVDGEDEEEEGQSVCAQFICDHKAEHLLENRNGVVQLKTDKAASHFELLKQNAGHVDIKGQI